MKSMTDIGSENMNLVQKILTSIILGSVGLAFGLSAISAIICNDKVEDVLHGTSLVFAFAALFSFVALIISFVWWGLAWW